MEYREKFYTDCYGNDFRSSYRGNRNIFGCEFRYTPIPGTGTSWWRDRRKIYRSVCKRIKLEAVHGGEYTRGKRSMTYLWDKYEDDYPRSNWNAKDWKTCTKRKHQYK